MSKFTKINEGKITSTDGFTVKFSHYHLSYIETKKALSADIEHCTDPYRMIIGAKTINKWHPPFDSEKISDQKKRNIIKRIGDALDYLGVEHVFE